MRNPHETQSQRGEQPQEEDKWKGGGQETGSANDKYIMYMYVIIKELKKLSKKCPESLLIKSLSPSVVTPNWNCIKAKKRTGGIPWKNSFQKRFVLRSKLSIIKSYVRWQARVKCNAGLSSYRSRIDCHEWREGSLILTFVVVVCLF